MTISTKVNSKVGLKRLSLGAALLFVGVSTLPAHALPPADATATGSVDYTVQTAGWKMTCIITDTGNLSIEGSPSSPFATATVAWGSTPNSRKGTVTYNYTFSWTGAPSGGLLKIDYTATAYALFQRNLQTAYAKGKIFFPFINATATAEAPVQTANVPVSNTTPSQGFISPANALTMNMVVEAEADVTTP